MVAVGMARAVARAGGDEGAVEVFDAHEHRRSNPDGGAAG
jgi:hypothetical protein